MMDFKQYQRWQRAVLVFVCISLMILIVPVGCSSRAPVPAPAPAPALTPETTKRSQDEAIVMVINRLQDLAETSEAKEYVALLFPVLSYYHEYLENLKGWGFSIVTLRLGAREGFEAAAWFQGDVVRYFELC